MENFEIPLQIRWSDLDPNFHLRHSVYYDWGAFCRVAFLSKAGFTLQRMQELQIGPILLREECIFKKEVKFGDNITIKAKIIKARRDFSRFTIQHEIIKNAETTSAIVTVDIAWLNAVTRRLAKLPEVEISQLSKSSGAEGFYWEE